MDNRPNDWVATILNNNPQSYEEVIANGVTPDNTTIQSADYYKSQKAVQDKFTTDGKFDEKAFDNFYTSAVSTFNEFSNQDWTNKLINTMAKDPLDWMQPLKTDVIDVSARVYNGINPERRSMSITGIGSVGDPGFSMREIAQANYVRDENGNKLDWTPDQKHGLLKSLFLPTVALAVYDKDGYYEENGRQVYHRKGEYMFDEKTGDPFYQVLGKKESYGREVLRYTDILTVDGTTLNKIDFFDSDGLTKSVGGVIAKTAFQIIPLLIPGFGEVYGTIGVFTGLASIMPTFAKGINGIITGSNDNFLGRGFTQAENWLQRFAPTQSDAGKSGFFNLENISDILSSSATQLYSQKQLAKLTRSLVFTDDAIRASKIGQSLSLGWLAATSSSQVYEDFKNAGASDRAAGIGMIASIAALYELMSVDYFREQFFKGTWLDESEAVDVIKNFTKQYGASSAVEFGGLGKAASNDIISNIGLFNKLKEGIKKAWEKAGTDWYWLGRKQVTGANGIPKVWNSAKRIVNRAANEGVEETMEEVSSDLIKAFYSGMDALGIPVTKDKQTSLDFGFTPEEIMKRYAATFLGGALGGATFEGIEIYNKHIGPKIVELSDLETRRQMSYLIATGHANELRDRATVLYEKGVLGNKNLSAIKTAGKNKNGETIYESGSETDNQNLYNYNLLLNQINYLENILQDAGMSFNFMYQIDPETGLPMIGMDGKFVMQDAFANELKKQQEVETKEKIDSEEYTYRNKENALIKAVEAYRQDTTYLNELAELASDIVATQAKIDSLQNSRPVPATDGAQKAQAETLKNNKELEFWLNHKKELLKRRDDLIYHRNDDVYAHQALFVTQKAIHEGMVGGKKTGDPVIDKLLGNPYWITTVEGYVKSKYNKNWAELNDSERDYLQKEYNRVKALVGVDQLIQASRVHYALLERGNEGLQKLNDLLKDRKLDTWFKHDMIVGASTEFQEFSELIETQSNLISEYNKLLEERNNYTKTHPDIESDEILLDLNQKLTNCIVELDDIEKRMEAFREKYDADKDVLNESVSQEGWDAFYKEFKKALIDTSTKLREISQAREIWDLYLRIEELNSFLSDNDESDPMYIQGTEELNSTIDKINSLNKKYGTNFSDEAEIVKFINDANQSIRENNNSLLESVKTLYQHLSANNIVSENDNILKATLKTIIDPILSNWSDEMFSNVFEDVFKTLSDSEMEKLLPVQKDIENKVKDYLINLKNGDIDAAEQQYFALGHFILSTKINTGIELGKSSSFKNAENLISGVSNGLDLQGFITAINSYKSDLLGFSVIDLVRDFNLNIDDNTLKIIDVIEREQGVFYTQGQSSYITNNEVYRKALEQIPGVINLLASVVNSAYSGMNETLNFYRDIAEKDRLISDISENTKNILQSDFSYLMQKATWLQLISDKNAMNKKEFHRNSEMKIKTDFIKNLFFAKDAEDSLLNKLKAINIDVEKAWEEAGGTEDTYQNVNKDNFVDFNTVFIKFLDIIREQSGIASGKERAVEIGKVLAKALPNNAFKMISGKITDRTDSTLTQYSTIIYLATALGTQASEFFKALKIYEFDGDELKFVPIIGQEWNIHIGYAYEECPEIFGEILNELQNQAKNFANTLTNDSQKSYMENLSKLPNFLFIQGGLGSGKTQVILRTLNTLFSRKYKNYRSVFVAPHDTQLNTFINDLGVKKEDTLLVEELLDKIYPKHGNLELEKDVAHSCKIDDNLPTKTKTNAVFADPKEGEKFVIFIDEGTWLSEKDLQLITSWAHENGVMVICTGDLKQNGKSVINANNQKAFSGLDDCLFITGPELTESIRMANVAKSQNLMNVTVLIENTLDYYKQNPNINLTEIDNYLRHLISANKSNTTSISLKYYDTTNTFAGDRFISKDNLEQYIDKFINLSRELRKDLEKEEDRKPRVAIITNDGDKWKNKDIEVITGDKVQGGEFDFVIIDKTFGDGDKSLFIKLRDFYTLIGRSRYGTAIVGNDDFIKEFDIVNSEVDKSIADKPVSFADDADELRAWKKAIISKLWETPESEKTDEKTDDENPVIVDNNYQRDAAGFELDDGKEGAIAPTGSTQDDQNKKLEQLTDEAKEDADVKKHEQSKNKKKAKLQKQGNAVSDREGFVKFLWSKGFDASETSNDKSIFKWFDQTDTGAIDFKNFIQAFSSAAMFNMSLDRDHMSRFRGIIDESVLRSILIGWTSENRKYVAKTIGNNLSVIYWSFRHNGEEYYIPIATIDKSMDGELILNKDESLFKQQELSTLVSGKNNVILKNIITHGRIVGPVRILGKLGEDTIGTSDKNSWLSKGANDTFVSSNQGKSFIVWSESEIVTDDDIASIFKYKLDGDKKVFYIDVQSATKVGSSYVYTLPNGAQIRLIPVHRTASVARIYDIVNIMRYALGAITLEMLTADQRNLLGPRNTRDGAIEMLKSVFGKDFSLFTGVSGDNSLQRAGWADNLRKLATECRLLSSNRANYIFGALYNFFEKPENSKYRTSFTENVIKFLRRDVKETSTQSIVRSGAIISFRLHGKGNFRNYKSYFVAFDNNDKSYHIFEYNSGKTSGRLGSEIGSVEVKGISKGLKLIDIVELINNHESNKNATVDLKDGITSLLDSNSITIKLVKQNTTKEGKVFYNDASDYDVLGALLNIPALDFSALEESITQNDAFKSGVYLNDNGSKYQVGDDYESNDPKMSAWRVSTFEENDSYPLLSDVSKISGSIFTLTKEFNIPEPEVNPGVVGPHIDIPTGLKLIKETDDDWYDVVGDFVVSAEWQRKNDTARSIAHKPSYNDEKVVQISTNGMQLKLEDGSIINLVEQIDIQAFKIEQVNDQKNIMKYKDNLLSLLETIGLNDEDSEKVTELINNWANDFSEPIETVLERINTYLLDKNIVLDGTELKLVQDNNKYIKGFLRSNGIQFDDVSYHNEFNSMEPHPRTLVKYTIDGEDEYIVIRYVDDNPEIYNITTQLNNIFNSIDDADIQRNILGLLSNSDNIIASLEDLQDQAANDGLDIQEDNIGQIIMLLTTNKC